MLNANDAPSFDCLPSFPSFVTNPKKVVWCCESSAPPLLSSRSAVQETSADTRPGDRRFGASTEPPRDQSEFTVELCKQLFHAAFTTFTLIRGSVPAEWPTKKSQNRWASHGWVCSCGFFLELFVCLLAARELSVGALARPSAVVVKTAVSHQNKWRLLFVCKARNRPSRNTVYVF